jgi:hypothetical protein
VRVRVWVSGVELTCLAHMTVSRDRVFDTRGPYDSVTVEKEKGREEVG